MEDTRMGKSCHKIESGMHPARLKIEMMALPSSVVPHHGDLPRVSESPQEVMKLLQGEKAMTPEKYVPDYIIYDELKRQRQERASREERPQLEMPRYIPFWPEAGFDEPGDEHKREDEQGEERGEVIIQMI